MPLIARLLRLLLCVLLVANGVSGASAGARMTSANGFDRATTQPADTAVPPCHEQAGETPEIADVATSAATGDSPDGNCCEQGLCQCLCTPASPQFAHVLRVAASSVGRCGTARAPAGTRPSPRLAHLIRPPIG